MFVVISFIGFTALVGIISYFKSKGDNLSTKDGYFLAGRTLSGVVIAGSLMLTNLSTEQLIGQSGQSFRSNMGPMAWEATSCLALTFLALWFLPKYLQIGITTVPEFLENRYDSLTKRIISILFLLGYLFTYLPTVLYSGALVLNQIFGVDKIFGVTQFQGVIITVVALGIVSSIYAIFGGLKAVAVSDTVNSVGLLIGGFMVPILAIFALGQNDGFIAGVRNLINMVPAEKWNAINPVDALPPMVPWPILFTGMLFNNLFYWCTNQTIIQRALGAKNLKEAQKGAILAGFLKLVTPWFIVLSGIIAYRMYMNPSEGFFTETQISNLAQNGDLAYSTLVLSVMPKPLLGFFAAVLFGAILSSFDSALNSSSTMYTLDIHREVFNRNATDEQLIKVGKIFGTGLALVSILVAPLVSFAPTGLYDFLQECFGFYSMPILAIVIVGLASKRVPASAPKIVLVFHIILYTLSKFLPLQVHYLYVLSVLFPLDVLVMLLVGKLHPRKTDYILPESHAVDLTPWKYAKPCAACSIILMLAEYLLFSPVGLAK
jgi:solute:Na+ symporter, SSS family